MRVILSFQGALSSTLTLIFELYTSSCPTVHTRTASSDKRHSKSTGLFYLLATGCRFFHPRFTRQFLEEHWHKQPGGVVTRERMEKVGEEGIYVHAFVWKRRRRRAELINCASVIPHGTTRLIFHSWFSVTCWHVDESLSISWGRCIGCMMSRSHQLHRLSPLPLPACMNHPSPASAAASWAWGKRWQEPEEVQLSVSQSFCQIFKGIIVDPKMPLHTCICLCMCVSVCLC